ncbi:MAG: ZIP family magnesium transporter [Acidobacteria bacterium]|nr:MAG: ZIP family magnesium transporter [Acidobacteriota bacterium]
MLFAIEISLVLAVAAGVANLFGASIVSARAWSRPFLAYFLALGSGFMLATAMTEMIPESLRLAPVEGSVLILAGYLIVHIFEHVWPAHFHFGEETHKEEFARSRVAYTALGGLLVHTFFDGVAIVSGFMVSTWLGTVIFGATILHNVPEGFTISSVMVTAGKGRGSGMKAAGALGISRILGVLTMGLAHRWVALGLALSAGATLYVAASDLIPEVNKKPGIRIALTVGAGVALVVVLKTLFM